MFSVLSGEFIKLWIDSRSFRPNHSIVYPCTKRKTKLTLLVMVSWKESLIEEIRQISLNDEHPALIKRPLRIISAFRYVVSMRGRTFCHRSDSTKYRSWKNFETESEGNADGSLTNSSMIRLTSENKQAHTQWRSEAKCRMGPTIKVPPFLPFKFLYTNFKWKFMFHAYLKIEGIIKHFQNCKQTLTTWNVSCFWLSIMIFAFSACRHLSHQ